jgi:hypothetical protein
LRVLNLGANCLTGAFPGSVFALPELQVSMQFFYNMSRLMPREYQQRRRTTGRHI